MTLVVATILQALEQFGMTTGAHFGITELSFIRALYLTAQLFCHSLHAITDTEHGYT